MMKITILAVGKIKEKFYTDAISEYKKRLGTYCRFEVIEVADEKTNEHASQAEDIEVKEKEGLRILKALQEQSYCIVLAIQGKKMDSVTFAQKLEQLGVTGNSHITFVIGGSLGVSQTVLNRADALLSFSDMTFPHQLMRVILTEQIYRAFRIQNHHPYHK